MFLVTGLVVASDYQSDDVLCLRRIIRDDVLRLGFLFSTPGLQAAHWSVFDGLSWAAHTLNSAVDKLFLVLKEVFEGNKSRKIHQDADIKMESLTETERIKPTKNINHFSKERDYRTKDSNDNRNSEKPKQFENQDKSNRWKH